jgi:phosphate/sulfate permease
MKKLVLALPMLMVANICFAEAGKDIHVSRGLIIGFALIFFAVAAVILYALSAAMYAMFNASISRRRASRTGTFIGSIIGAMFGVIVELMVEGERYQDPSIWPILIFAVAGMAFGFAFSPAVKDDILDQ